MRMENSYPFISEQVMSAYITKTDIMTHVVSLLFLFVSSPRAITKSFDLGVNRTRGSIHTEVKRFFLSSCGSLIPFTRANAQWVIHGFN